MLVFLNLGTAPSVMAHCRAEQRVGHLGVEIEDPPEMTPLLEVSLVPRPVAPAEARKSLLAIASRLPPDLFEDVRLLVSELVTNSVRHSGLNGEKQLIGFAVREKGRSLRFEVSDPGPGPRRKVRAVTDDQVSGWGLQIVDRLSQRWGVVQEPWGSTVWFEVDL